MVQLAGDLYGVNRELLRRAYSAARERDISIRINSGYRSIDEQWVLYRRYLAGDGPIAAYPGKSWHNYRGALDAKWVDGVPLRERRGVIERHGLAFTVESEPWHIQRSDDVTKAGMLAAPYWRGLDVFPARVGGEYPLAVGDFFGRDVADPEVWNGSEGATNWHRVWAIQAKFGIPFADRDGIFGEQTEARAIEFQKERGLPASGLVGERTWKEMAG